MGEKKATGPIRRGLKYLVSPRFFLSSEVVSKYGGFSIRYHKELISAIKLSLKRLRESKENTSKFTVTTIEDRIRIFYDALYESAVEEGDIEQIHAKHRKSALLFFIASFFFIALSGLLFVIPKITLIPNAIIAIATLITALTIIINGLSYNYYAWLIEQRLLPEIFSFTKYMSKPIKRWPKKALSRTMTEEISREYKARDQVLRDYIKGGNTLDDIGLAHLKERVFE